MVDGRRRGRSGGGIAEGRRRSKEEGGRRAAAVGKGLGISEVTARWVVSSDSGIAMVQRRERLVVGALENGGIRDRGRGGG